MARLLVKAVDNVNPAEPENDHEQVKRGDVVAIHEDNEVWGSEEGLPDFIQIEMPGVPKSEVRYLLDLGEELFSKAVPRAARSIPQLVPRMMSRIPRATAVRYRYKIDVDGDGSVINKQKGI